MEEAANAAIAVHHAETIMEVAHQEEMTVVAEVTREEVLAEVMIEEVAKEKNGIKILRVVVDLIKTQEVAHHAN